MKASEFRKLIREEIRKVLKEATIDSSLLSKLKAAMTARISDPEDENAHDEVQDLLMQIYKKAGYADAEELAAGNMEDEVTMTGPLSAVVSLIKDTMSASEPSSKGIAILNVSGDYNIATIEKTPTGSEIYSRFYAPGGRRNSDELAWKYSYAGSPADMLKSLIAAKVIKTVGSKFLSAEFNKENNLDKILKTIKADPKFKKVS